MKMKTKTKTKTQRVVIETARRRYVGDLTLPAEGYHSRLSDLLNRGDHTFLSVTNATLRDLDLSEGPDPAQLDFLAIGIGQIETVYPAPT